WRCPRGSSTDTPVARILARSAYRSSTTTRNLRTVERLATA
ncbi:pyridoxamine 5-phosphate oxidase, partial [Rathayibacter sp. AY2B7]